MVREIRAEDIDIALALDAHPSVPIGDGGHLRLGGQDSETAIEQLLIRGRVVYRPNSDAERHTLEAEAERIAMGIDAVAIGERRLTVGNAQVARVVQACLHLSGITPTSFEGHLELIELSDIHLTHPAS
jgi:hypothetical protein